MGHWNLGAESPGYLVEGGEKEDPFSFMLRRKFFFFLFSFSSPYFLARACISTTGIVPDESYPRMFHTRNLKVHEGARRWLQLRGVQSSCAASRDRRLKTGPTTVTSVLNVGLRRLFSYRVVFRDAKLLVMASMLWCNIEAKLFTVDTGGHAEKNAYRTMEPAIALPRYSVDLHSIHTYILRAFIPGGRGLL